MTALYATTVLTGPAPAPATGATALRAVTRAGGVGDGLAAARTSTVSIASGSNARCVSVTRLPPEPAIVSPLAGLLSAPRVAACEGDMHPARPRPAATITAAIHRLLC